MKFNETQLGVISNALRVAAEQFKEDAAKLAEQSISARFALQATEAMALYNAIAEKTGIAS